MFAKTITSMLLASSMLASMVTGPAYTAAGDEAANRNLDKYEVEAGSACEESSQEALLNSEEKGQTAALEEGRLAAGQAADAAEAVADEAWRLADETEDLEIEEAAKAASEDAAKARIASDLANSASDSYTVAIVTEIARAAQAAAEEAAARAREAAEAEAAAQKAAEEAAAREAAEAEAAAREAAEAEAAAREAEALASAEYLGHFTLTAYCNCASCCGTAGNATASGVMPTAGHTVAMSGLEFGTKLLINGTVYTVEDLGTPYGHVDIFMDSHEEALEFGMSSADVYLVNM